MQSIKIKRNTVKSMAIPLKNGTGKSQKCTRNILKNLKRDKGLFVYNLGTGKGYSVLEIVEAFEKATGVKIPYQIVERRPGDIPACYADTTKAKEEIGFECKYDLLDMCKDSWNWQQKNPNGYAK